MSSKERFYVAAVGAAAGLLSFIVYWVVATPDAEYRDIAIGVLVYGTGYALAVPRAIRWVGYKPTTAAVENESTSQG